MATLDKTRRYRTAPHPPSQVTKPKAFNAYVAKYVKRQRHLDSHEPIDPAEQQVYDLTILRFLDNYSIGDQQKTSLLARLVGNFDSDGSYLMSPQYVTESVERFGEPEASRLYETFCLIINNGYLDELRDKIFE